MGDKNACKANNTTEKTHSFLIFRELGGNAFRLRQHLEKGEGIGKLLEKKKTRREHKLRARITREYRTGDGGHAQ